MSLKGNNKVLIWYPNFNVLNFSGSETEMGNCLGKSSEVVLPSEDSSSTVGDTLTERLEIAKSSLPNLSEETDRLVTGNDVCDSKENPVRCAH